MAFTKTEFKPGNKLPASKVNEIQDAILEHDSALNTVNKSVEDINKTLGNVDDLVKDVVKTVNGKTPDTNGNVEIEVGGVTEDDLAGLFPKTTELDFTNWNNGAFTEKLSDGSTYTHDVLFDGNGNIIGIGNITIK